MSCSEVYFYNFVMTPFQLYSKDSLVSCHSSISNNNKNENNGIEVVCSKKHFHCDGRRRCIPYHWLCDNHKDCWDQSDESPKMTCYNHTCPMGMFRCVTRLICIDAEWRCDGFQDCGPEDNSDEVNCK